MTTGYSGRPLEAKLGIKAGSRVAIIDPPSGFDLILPPDALVVVDGPADVVVSFHVWRRDLEASRGALKALLHIDGALWTAWPKRSSKVPTDLTEDVMREIWLPMGLVDTKVIAVDAVWSALRFSWRRELRG